LACDTTKKLDAKVSSFGHLTLTLSLHYRVKCRDRSLAIDNNEFLPSTVCVGSEIINWITTNAIGNYYHSKSTRVTLHHLCYSTCSKLMSSCTTNTSGRRWHH